MAISKDMVVDYATDNTGVADAATKFHNNLKPDMAGQDCILTIPAGSYKFASSCGQPWATGMTSLVATATGATLFNGTSCSVVLGSRNTAQKGIDAVDGQSARIQTVSAGATSVTLTAESVSAGHISRAVVGQWMMVCGWDIQGSFQAAFGFPSNFHFLEFVQITDVTGDVISFTPALQNYYSADWPEFNRGSSGEQDSGGPASVFFMHADWGAPKEYIGGTYDNDNLIKCEGRDFTMTGGESVNYPIYPTVNQTWRAINHDASGAALVEHDKLCDTVIVQGGSYTQWHCQSSSTRMLSMDGVTLSSHLNGTPRNAIIDNCAIAGNLTIGPNSYGRGDTFICRNTSIGGTIGGGLTEKGPNDVGLQAYARISGGVITIPKCIGAQRVFMPDAHGRNVLFWVGDSGRILPGFKVLSATSDPWPAVDDQTTTTNVTMANGSKNLEVSSAIFTSDDLYKVIIINGARSGGNPLRTFITAFTDSTHVTVFDACSNASGLSASSQQVQWGTSNVYIQTDSSGFPDSSLWTGGKINLLAPPARSVYFENVTGSDLALDISQPGAQNKPLWSYTKRTYDGTLSGVGGEEIFIYGNIVSIKVNVTKAYTGTQGTLTAGLSQNNNVGMVVGGLFTTYGPRFNLKAVGERIIVPGEAVVGAQSGDTNLSIASGPAWLTRSNRPSVSADITGEDPSVYPSFTVEVITDQGFSTGPTAVVPLRFRLKGP